MICNSCGKEIHNGYFWENGTVHYICVECLLSYKEKSMNKYDHDMIMRLHKAGIDHDRIAVIMGAKHKKTIDLIVWREERKELKREQNKVYQHRRFKTEEED